MILHRDFCIRNTGEDFIYWILEYMQQHLRYFKLSANTILTTVVGILRDRCSDNLGSLWRIQKGDGCYVSDLLRAKQPKRGVVMTGDKGYIEIWMYQNIESNDHQYNSLRRKLRQLKP